MIQNLQIWNRNRKPKPKITFLTTVVILASLPCSTLTLPGDPAPGRSPGPPVTTENFDYDETTTEDATIEGVSEIGDVSDACAFARIPSDSGDIVTLSDDDCDVNLTVSHPVFEAEELVRGVVYDGK